jgi:hypothetical protein
MNIERELVTYPSPCAGDAPGHGFVYRAGEEDEAIEAYLDFNEDGAGAFAPSITLSRFEELTPAQARVAAALLLRAAEDAAGAAGSAIAAA